jgi:diguanylate cyclase (GGDEF)-like protein
MCLVMIDLDHFKTLNDEHGHLFGDEVLRGASEALAAALRTSDTAYRYGGEEFAVLLRETGLEAGHEVADRIRRAISDAAVPRHGVLVTASAGVAERVSTMAHHTELVAKADEALYRAKRDGRDQVATATD